MNRSALNTATINGIVPDVVQRTVLVSRAYAVVGSKVTILSRGPVVCFARAGIDASCHIIQRPLVACRARASIDCKGAERRRMPVACSGTAGINLVGTWYPRQSYSQPVAGTASAQVLAWWRSVYRAPVTAQQEACITVETGSVFYKHMRPVVTTCRAVIAVDGEVIKKIPFNGNAPDDRTMVLSAESRLMVWL